MDKQTRYIIAGTLVLTSLLIGAGVFLNQGSTKVASAAPNWGDTEIECLVNGHAGLASHIHPRLTILVDGVSEPIPANVGLTDLCMAEVHTHDASGTLHIESFEAGREFTLDDFFQVWGKDFERGGYTVSVSVDGRDLDKPLEHVFSDAEQISISYQSLGLPGVGDNSGATASSTE